MPSVAVLLLLRAPSQTLHKYKDKYVSMAIILFMLYCQEEEARERQEQVATGRMLPLVGASGYDFGLGAGGGRLKHFVDEDDLEVGVLRALEL